MDLRKLLNLPIYQPLNLIEISRDNLLHNYKVLSSINPKIKIAPVLKSNAYGHGMKEIAKILDSSPSAQNDGSGGAPFFCVDSIYEAYELYKASIKTPILINDVIIGVVLYWLVSLDFKYLCLRNFRNLLVFIPKVSSDFA